MTPGKQRYVANLAPIVIFAFNRPEHLQRTLDALAANTLAAESDVFYCDGLRNGGDAQKIDAAWGALKPPPGSNR